MSVILIAVINSLCIGIGLWLLIISLSKYYYIGGYNKGEITGEWGSHGWSYARFYLYLDGILLGEGVSFTHPPYSYVERCSKSELKALYEREERELRRYITERLEMTFDEYVNSLKRKRIKILAGGLILFPLGVYIFWIMT